MWFDPCALLASKPPPAVFAFPGVLLGGPGLKPAHPQKPQTPSTDGDTPRTAEPQKPQAPVSATTAPAPGPDRWAWPHSDAWNTAEIELFNRRAALFVRRGAGEPQAEAMADRLVNRDRDDDDRRLCLECRHLRGEGPYRCGNARAAGVHADLARDLVLTLQRCHGHEDARLPMGVIADAAPPAPASEPAPAPAPTPSGPTWRELDRAYLAHHQQCTACQCAGRGYGQRCAIGMQLWTAYSSMNSDLKG